MSNIAKFDKSQIYGDAVLGDKYQYDAPLSPLEQAIRSIQSSIKENPTLEHIIEELAEYVTDRPDREIIGVEGKLTRGKREDLIKNAVYLKNKFERKLAKKQMSLVEQKVYAHILATINTAFNQKIRPLILEGKKKSEVDNKIHDEIISPVYKAIVSYDIGVTAEHVSGMLYFLTGKCHLSWSE